MSPRDLRLAADGAMAREDHWWLIAAKTASWFMATQNKKGRPPKLKTLLGKEWPYSKRRKDRD